MTHAPPESAAPSRAAQKLPLFLRFSISALVVVSVITIMTLFIDTVEYRGSRIFLTFLIFGTFVALTALDSFRGRALTWYAPAALISNVVALGASLLMTWAATSGSYWLGTPWAQLPAIIGVWLLVRGAVLISLWMLHRSDERESSERGVGVAASFAAIVSAAVYVVYLTCSQLIPRVPLWDIDSSYGPSYDASLAQMYSAWDIVLKVGTAGLIITGLLMSIKILLRWFYGADARAARRVETAAVVSRVGAPAAAVLPWPAYAEGDPYPATEGGQPDFAAAEAEIARRSGVSR